MDDYLRINKRVPRPKSGLTPALETAHCAMRRARDSSVPDTNSEDTTINIPSDAEIVDVTDDSDDPYELDRDVSPGATQVFDQADIPDGHELLDFTATNYGAVIRPKDSVELQSGAFMRIMFITRDRAGDISIRGLRLLRHRDVDKKFGTTGELHSLLPRSRNELCAILKVSVGTENPTLTQSLECVSLQEVLKVRIITLTNRAWSPLESALQDAKFSKNWRDREEMGELSCRWKYIEEEDRVRRKIVAFQLRQLDQAECDPGHGVPTVARFFEHQGPQQQSQRPESTTSRVGKRKSMASSSTAEAKDVIELDDSDDEPVEKKLKHANQNLIDLTLDDTTNGPTVVSRLQIKQSRKSVETLTFTNSDGKEEQVQFTVEKESPQQSQRKRVRRAPRIPRQQRNITYGDLCSGAGGTARGAELAGLKLKFLLDWGEEECQTLRLNFPGVGVFRLDVSEFATDCEQRKIDVLHISFPCQGFSSLNRGLNPELDAERICVSYGAFTSVLKKCQPRIVTLEQVRGIIQRGNETHFRAQISALTTLGYSVRWKVINFANHGNSQGRHRFIVIASCPGQSLPSWPAPTHGPGISPFVTIQDILDRVPAHVQGVMAHANRCDEVPYDPNTQLRGCVDRQGGYRKKKAQNNYHPSGKRLFNLQEKAQLQGFPDYHQFCGGITAVGRQIGNAVPPVFAEQMFNVCITAIEKTDREIEESKKPITLDD
ncbi:DNA (cytosine-5)-methyltransferase 3 [Pseudocercospora fuligena]|uniref:DNA (cytosine-5-)-methyltransferase n=1 Tax=Pseudocercospora fuligena TaxID=685502 RepID=A0A8H6VKJ3_9PEZI|nr:DNA (cytosine-5)-methyltransferase 3 [Pseudocercospora fuligena]